MLSTAANRRIATTVGIVAPALLITNIAFAAWTANGEGPGQANAGTATDLTITASIVSDVGDVLYPNNDGNIRFVIDNPNPYNVDVAAVTFGAVSASGDCVTHDVDFDDVTDLGMVVGANATLNVELIDHAHMGNDSTDDCQGETFTATVTITGASTDAVASTGNF